MEMWQWRREMNKLNEVERYFYNAMCRKPKHINCPNIVLKRATRHKTRYIGGSGYLPYGLYCKNHSVFLQWVPDELSNCLTWSKLGIQKEYNF